MMSICLITSILSKDTEYPEHDDNHCGDSKWMSMERVRQITPEKPCYGSSQSTSRTPVYAHICQRAQAVACIYRTAERQGKQCSDPDKCFQVPSDKDIYLSQYLHFRLGLPTLLRLATLFRLYSLQCPILCQTHRIQWP